MKQKENLRILFIARNYPPVIGGLEKNAEGFYGNLKNIANIDLLANTRGKKHLVSFLTRAIVFLLFKAGRYDVIHFNDAVLSPIIPLIRLFSKAKVTFTVNGLDVVFDDPFYQRLVHRYLTRADRVFPISKYTSEECLKRGVNPERIRIIPVGLIMDERRIHNEIEVQNFLSKNAINVGGRKIIVSIGRLVERKGHAWFIRSVFPSLPDDYVYIIGGEGPERQKITHLIEQAGLKDRVFSIGRVTEEEKEIMYQVADLFIMPNITVKNDPEGFGIVLLEAGSYNVPVVATDIEGISSAVMDGVTGRLIPEGDVQGFVTAISNPLLERDKIRSIIEKYFNWNSIAQQYLDEFKFLCK